jgi:hypothetical protein
MAAYGLCSAIRNYGAQPQEDEKECLGGLGRLLGDGAQQPADVEARRARHRVQRITLGSLQPAPVHAVIGLEVTSRTRTPRMVR